MWIFDLTASAACVVVVIASGAIAFRKYIKSKHPEPSLQEEIEYYDNLNTQLKQQEEEEWARQLARQSY